MVPFAPGFFKPMNSGRRAVLNGDITVYVQLDYTTLLGGSLGGSFHIGFGDASVTAVSPDPTNVFSNLVRILHTGNLNTGGLNVYINNYLNGGLTPSVNNTFTWTNKSFVKIRAVWRNGVGVYVYADDVLVYQNESAGFSFEQALPWFGNYGVFSVEDSWNVFRDLTVLEYGTLSGWSLNCRTGEPLGSYTILTGDGNPPGIFLQTADGLKIRGTYLNNHGSVQFT